MRIPLSVNISGRSLCDREFIALAIDLVASAQADICFEVTETAIIQDPELALEMIAALTREGILVSIDDYGTGFASLSYLKQISAQELKLDRSLIQNVDASSRERLILKSTIDLAHSIGLKVVAEGVEESLTRDFLVAMGCDTIQGYLISRPLTLDGLFAFARANKLSFADDALLGSYSEAGTDALRRGRSV
jgi:EAL domain-containing protein (putative c-di-GMP-specific phosphodiesterase class I)